MKNRLEKRNEDVSKLFDTKEEVAETITQQLGNITDISRELMNYARSFQHVGNPTVADDLSHYALELRDITDVINKAEGRRLSTELAEGQSSMGFMLGSILDATLKDK